MSESFVWWLQWQEIPEDGVPRDFAERHESHIYSDALDRHRNACGGGWVEPRHCWPSVSELVGMTSGKSRIIRAGAQCWSDDRPKLSKEEFSRLWRGLVDGEQWSGFEGNDRRKDAA